MRSIVKNFCENIKEKLLYIVLIFWVNTQDIHLIYIFLVLFKNKEYIMKVS